MALVTKHNIEAPFKPGQLDTINTLDMGDVFRHNGAYIMVTDLSSEHKTNHPDYVMGVVIAAASDARYTIGEGLVLSPHIIPEAFAASITLKIKE